ncbi:hypothetical protein BHE74_00025535 [Ensete ventricosum]|nr:hypothetical protein GW17_00023352 [Ensete ventricosum]RWW67047.1 hypothetical protein BHE74_00025535 [Ensete ventricosum]
MVEGGRIETIDKSDTLGRLVGTVLCQSLPSSIPGTSLDGTIGWQCSPYRVNDITLGAIGIAKVYHKLVCSSYGGSLGCRQGGDLEVSSRQSPKKSRGDEFILGSYDPDGLEGLDGYVIESLP